MNYDKNKDGNEDDLVEQLRRLGFSVERLYYVGRGVPDLLVGGEMPCPYCLKEFWQERVIEVKQEGKGLRPNQVKWWQKWRPYGEATIARNREDINRIVGRTGSPLIWFDEQTKQDADQERGAPRKRQARAADHRRARRLPDEPGPPALPDPGHPGTD